MKKGLIAIVMLVLLGGGAYAAFRREGASVNAPEPTASVSKASDQVVAEAKVVPVQSAALSFSSGGAVDKALVQVGDRVQAGQPLAWLDATMQRDAVAQAAADFAQAQASYQDLLAGATPEELAVAEAQLRQAQAQLRTTNGSVTDEDMLAAEAQLQQARAQLTRLAAGPKRADLRVAEAQLSQAQANLQTQRDRLSAIKTNAQLQLQQAADALTRAQSHYSTALQNWQYVQDTGNDPINVAIDPRTGKRVHVKLTDAQRQQYHDAFVQAEAAMHSAESAVQAAQVAYDNARQAEITGIQAAEAQVASAQAILDKLRAGADADQLAAARAQVAGSTASLDKLRGEQRSGTLEAGQAAVDVAQAQLDKLRAGAPKSKLAVAQAQVQRAQAALELAQTMLDHQSLKAPFAGVVASVDLKVGEYRMPGAPVIQLADLSSWQIETDDLTERNVVNIREGAPVTITFDAIPGLELPGKVKRIDAFGADKHGDITYTVVIALDRHDERLRWNMTASVTINVAGT